MLVLIRHAAVVVDPPAPSDTWGLSPDGATQAVTLAKHPALIGVELFASSPEPKAMATAKALAGDRAIVVVEDLRELNRQASGWVGTAEEYAELVTTILERPTESLRGCEIAVQAGRRITRAIEDLLSANPNRQIAIVSHGIVLTLYLSMLLGPPRPDLAIWRRIAFPDIAIVDPIGRKVIVEFGEANDRVTPEGRITRQDL